MKTIFPSPRDVARVMCVVAVLALVTGCGNKGPLVPPKAMATLSASASTGSPLSASEARSQC